MADESNTGNTEIVETAPPAEVATPKKRRGPRPKNVAADATAESPEAAAAQPAKAGRKRADKSVDGTLSVETPAVRKTRAKKVAKSAGETRGAKPSTVTTAHAPVLDDIADLLQLEEENSRLRKALAKKLRAENADLRKRLGLA
ncbi:SyrB-like regulator (plasmid) [Ensifer adhaerens]|uniref:SyrB-like regulator n=1 Tax=Ensifer adhaerens TaxID=106592 RepID=UPI000DD92AA7|nr:SyrB-like regulator [Ensifer adhaerens]UTV40674.1 SyrB-like regulator [Ensifer adhaerens]